MTRERGYIALSRDILRHPVVGASKPYTRHTAWVWLLIEAVWKPSRGAAEIGRSIRTYDLQRGQLSHSLRYIANEWRWTVKSVRSFLAVLQKHRMITTQTDTGQTVITICNYDVYQSPTVNEETQTDTQKGTQWARNGHNIEEGKKERRDLDKTADAVPAKNYEFNGSIIKLTKPHFSNWERAFPNLDLRAELTARDAWLASTGPAEQGSWFVSTSKYLANRNSEAKTRLLALQGNHQPGAIREIV